MKTTEFFNFLAMLIIAGFILNYSKMKLLAHNPDSRLGNAIAFVY